MYIKKNENPTKRLFSFVLRKTKISSTTGLVRFVSIQIASFQFVHGQVHGRNFFVNCGGTGWCETNILRRLKRKCGEHSILYPHCLKKWGMRPPCPLPNCAHGQVEIFENVTKLNANI